MWRGRERGGAGRAEARPSPHRILAWALTLARYGRSRFGKECSVINNSIISIQGQKLLRRRLAFALCYAAQKSKTLS